MRSPVALFIFRRPDTTARVLDAIRAARPSLLFVVADGPRSNRPDDAAACAAARALIDGVDWPCEVRREFATENMGCRRRVASGLAWVFSRSARGDHPGGRLPALDETFAGFCDRLLHGQQYRDDPRVAQISGANSQKGRSARRPRLLFHATTTCGAGRRGAAHSVCTTSTCAVGLSCAALRLARRGSSTTWRLVHQPDSGVPGHTRRPYRHLGLPVGLCIMAARHAVGRAESQSGAKHRVRTRREPHASSRPVRE